MLHQEFDPPDILKDTVKCFWYNCREHDDQSPEFVVMPDGYVEIIFHFEDVCKAVSDNGVHSLPSPFMMGLLNHPAKFYASDRLQILAVRCFPWTVFDLLGLPSDKSAIQSFKHPVAYLQPCLERFIQAGDIQSAISTLKQHFVNIRLQVSPSSLLYKAGVAMQSAGGNVPVAAVAAAAHVTVRTLERKFKQSSGHTVKDVAALMRFEQVRNSLWQEPERSIAGLAHEVGYTDQSHLSREFKRYSGTTPAAFARKARESKTFTENDFVAFVQS